MPEILTDIQIKSLKVSLPEYNELVEPPLPNRAEVFPLDTYWRRLRNLQVEMRKGGISVALLVSPDAQCWLHGYQARWYRAETTTEWPPCNFTVVWSSPSSIYHSVSYTTELELLGGAEQEALRKAWREDILVFDSSDHEKLLELTSRVEKSRFRYFDIPTVGADPDDADTSFIAVAQFVVDECARAKWFNPQWNDDEAKYEVVFLGLELCSHRQSAAVTKVFMDALSTHNDKPDNAMLGHRVEIKQGKEEGDNKKYISGMLRDLQTVKQPQELKWIREAGKILDSAYLHLKKEDLRWRPTPTAPLTIRPGLDPKMTELQVRAEMEWAMAQWGGENAGLENTISSTRSYCHAISSTREIGKGPLLLDPSGVKHRYHANTARMFYVGDEAPPLAVIKASLIAGGAIDVLKEKGAEILKVNKNPATPKSFADLNRVLLDYYKSFVVEDIGAVKVKTIWDRRDWIGGYQLGISFPPDWVGEFTWNVVTADTKNDEDRTESNKKFSAGLVTNFESFIGGYGFIDTIIFNEETIEVVSEIPQTLYLVHLGRHISYQDAENYAGLLEEYSKA